MPDTSTDTRMIETADRFIVRVLSPEHVSTLMDELGCHIRRGVFHPVMTI